MENRELAYLYTRGRFVKTYGKILDSDNEYLYEKGKYPSKIKREDLPEDYIEIRSKSIWNMIGYLKTSGILEKMDEKRKWLKENYGEEKIGYGEE